MNKDLDGECSRILKKLLEENSILRPTDKSFNVWDDYDAVEIVCQLLEEIRKSYVIREAHKNGWGKK